MFDEKAHEGMFKGNKWGEVGIEPFSTNAFQEKVLPHTLSIYQNPDDSRKRNATIDSLRRGKHKFHTPGPIVVYAKKGVEWDPRPMDSVNLSDLRYTID